MIKLTNEQFLDWKSKINKAFVNEVGYFEMRDALRCIVETFYCEVPEIRSYVVGSYVFIMNTEKREIMLVRTTDMKTAKAKCHKNDFFNAKTAIAICYARLNGIEVPSIVEYKTFMGMKPGDKFKHLSILYKFVCKVPGYPAHVAENLSNGRLEVFNDPGDYFEYAVF